MEYCVIAIVGDSGTPKSKVGFRVAELMGYRFLDIGLVWRLLAMRLMELETEVADESAWVDVANALVVDDLGLGWISSNGGVWSQSHLTRPGLAAFASKLAASDRLRALVADVVRGLYRDPGVVVVGRPFAYRQVFEGAYLRVLLHDHAALRAARSNDGETLEQMTSRDQRDRLLAVSSRPGHHATLSTEDFTDEGLVQVIVRLAGVYLELARERQVTP